MTRKELTGVRDLRFSQWVRERLPDSNTGFMVSDLDFILQNYKTKKVMLLEIKTRNSDLRTWQRLLFERIDGWLKNGVEDDWKYLGFHVIKFENQNFLDGKVYFDNNIITEIDLRRRLSF